MTEENEPVKFLWAKQDLKDSAKDFPVIVFSFKDKSTLFSLHHNALHSRGLSTHEGQYMWLGLKPENYIRVVEQSNLFNIPRVLPEFRRVDSAMKKSEATASGAKC